MSQKFQIVVPILFLFFQLQAQLQSPDDFLPHPLGSQFTPHHLLVDYAEQVAANSPNVELLRYGQTYENRPQVLLFISTPENLARLDQEDLHAIALYLKSIPGQADGGD